MVKPLALTLGDPAGIGPDIAIAAWLRREQLKLPAFYLTGDRDFLARRAALLGLDVELKDVRAEDAVATFPQALPVVSTGHAATAAPGQPDHSRADAGVGGRCHQPDCQERVVPCRVPASRPHRISRRTYRARR